MSQAESPDPKTPAPGFAPHRSVVLKLTLLVAVITAALLGVLLASGYRFWRDRMREQIDARLSAVAESRRDFVREWIRRQQDRVEIFATRGVHREWLEQRASGTPSEQLLTYAQRNLNRHVRSESALGARIADSQGKVVLSSDSAEVGNDLSADPVFIAGLAGPSVGLPQRVGERFVALAAAPTRRADESRETLGVLLLTLDVTPLAEALRDTTGLGKTGEVMLAVREGAQIRYLFPPRHNPAMLTFPLADSPAMSAATGDQPFFKRTRDYRGKSVLAAGRPVGYGGLGLVAKMDAAEAYAPIARAGRYALLLGGIVGLAGLAAAFLVARGFASPIRRLAAAAARVGGGDYGTPVPVKRNDELGALAASFNEMTAAIRARQTERDHAVEAVANERSLLRSVIDLLPDFIYVKDRESRFLGANLASARNMGVASQDELLGKTDADIYSAEAAAGFRADEVRTLEGQPVINREEEIVSPDGTKRIVLTTKVPFRDARGDIVGIVGTGRDITARKAAEAALRESEERLAAVVENLNEGLIIGDSAGNVFHWNPAALAMHGYASMEECRRKLPEFTDTFELRAIEGDRALPLEEWPMPRIMRGEVLRNCELRLRRLDQGWDRVISYSGSLVRSASGEMLAYLSAADITARKAAEAALRDSERRFRQLAESLPQLVWTCTADGLCDYLSPQWVAYTGIPATLQLGDRWLEQVHPEDRERVKEEWATVAPLGVQFDSEFRIRGHDGVYRWFSTRAAPVRDETGRVTKWFGTHTDIDDLHRATQEIHRLDAELEHRVSHDLQAPLQAIHDFSKTLLEDHGSRLDDEGRRLAGVIANEAERMAALIDSLLAMSRSEQQMGARADIDTKAAAHGKTPQV